MNRRTADHIRIVQFSVLVTTASLLGSPALAERAFAAEGAKIAAVEVRNLTPRTLTDVPVTFGHVFRQGDVPRGKHVHCLAGNRFAQVDAKRRYGDGSLRLPVISAIVPRVRTSGPAGGED